MDLDQVKKDIENWIVNFVEVPHPALGGWPPCPYARRARLEKRYDVRLGQNPMTDLADIGHSGLGDHEVVILVYDPDQWEQQLFAQMLEFANKNYLLEKDIIVLEDHPKDVEMVNGICMNQGTYALALVQSLGELNHKAQLMAKQGFYDSWSEDYLKSLFQHRKDPRK